MNLHSKEAAVNAPVEVRSGRPGTAARLRLVSLPAFLFLLALFPLPPLAAQGVSAPPATQAQPPSATTKQARKAVAVPGATSGETIDEYIHRSWNTLSRSMSECKSLVDPKVKAPPVLYLPAGAPAPAELVRVQSQCKVRVAHLPHPIVQLGDLKDSEIPQPGLLYLPNRYVVPGGRFNEMFGWDSFFIILGLLRDNRVDLARGMVENFFYEIENYGAVLNANRTYFLTRSQPPLLSSMIRVVYDAQIARDPSPANRARQKAWLTKAYSDARRDHDFWLRDIHRAGDTGLARYFDIGDGPVPDIADHSTYYIDVIRWLVAHPEVQTSYLIKAPEHPTPEQEAQLAQTSCDMHHSVVCSLAYFGGYRLSRDFYKGDRSVRESGFDITFRFGPFSGSTHHYAALGLNSLLYKYERDLADFATMLGLPQDAQEWNRQAEARKSAINKYLWNEKLGMFFDYDYTTGKQSTYVYATTFYPLWAGLASKEQAQAVDKNLGLLNYPGGLACSTYVSGLQWDRPFGWAPLNWFAMAGLEKDGYTQDARRIALEFTNTVRSSFEKEGTIHEKYNVQTQTSDVQLIAGYKNVVGFGWTNAVYMEMEHLLRAVPK
ncbi:MAG TPA: trehalase family glycosidase [Acidobacteriaceae bacterium]